MTPITAVLVVLGVWIVGSAAAATAWAVIATRFERRALRRKATRDMRGRWPYPPPVPGAEVPGGRIFPTVTQADIDAAWLDAWPQHRMPQTQVDRLFDDIVAMEGLQ